MSDPFDYFDRIYCINLDHRTDRWQRAASELRRIGLLERVERVSAVKAESGAHGCLASHVECVRRAQATGANTVLVLEDDVEFAADPRALLRPALRQLETIPTWEAFYLGGELLERATHKLGHVFRAPMLQTHAVALHRRAHARVLAATVPIDRWYARNLESYGLTPPAAFQITDESDISPGLQNRRRALERSHFLYLRAPYPVFLAARTLYRRRRRLGYKLLRALRDSGLPIPTDRVRRLLARRR